MVKVARDTFSVINNFRKYSHAQRNDVSVYDGGPIILKYSIIQ